MSLMSRTGSNAGLDPEGQQAGLTRRLRFG
jgi:hypothetical protein